MIGGNVTKKNAQKYLLNVLEKFYNKMDGNFPEGYDVKWLENEMTDLEKWHRDIMLESMAEGIERERAAVEMRRKEEEEKRKQMFPTPWEKDL